MSDEDDYGFEYSDEEELDDEQIDIENEYYNAKGATGRRERANRWGWRRETRAGGWLEKRRARRLTRRANVRAIDARRDA